MEEFKDLKEQEIVLKDEELEQVTGGLFGIPPLPKNSLKPTIIAIDGDGINDTNC